MQLPSITPVLKNSVDSKGYSMIQLRVTFLRQSYRKSTGIKVAPDNFNTWVTKEDASFAYKNKFLKEQITELELAFFKLAEKGGLDAHVIKSCLTGDNDTTTAKSVILSIKKAYTGQFDERVLTHWETVANKLEEFQPGIAVVELNDKKLTAFEFWLRDKKKNNQNTVSNNLKMLMSVLRKAASSKHRLITELPFTEYKKPGQVPSKRQYLTEDQITKIEEYADGGTNQTLRLVASWFALGCRTGLRYGDLCNWNEEKMIRGGKLYFMDEKTKTPQYVPVYPAMQLAIERVRNYRSIPTNEICNRYLKEIAILKEINSNLTMHIARHTFAVNYLTNGGSFEVLQPMMGHKKIATTQIYGKITNKRIDDETSRVWGK